RISAERIYDTGSSVRAPNPFILNDLFDPDAHTRRRKADSMPTHTSQTSRMADSGGVALTVNKVKTAKSSMLDFESDPKNKCLFKIHGPAECNQPTHAWKCRP